MNPPLVDSRGRLKGIALYFYVIDEYGDKVQTDERICDNCLVNGDLSQFGEEPSFKSGQKYDVISS